MKGRIFGRHGGPHGLLLRSAMIAAVALATSNAVADDKTAPKPAAASSKRGAAEIERATRAEADARALGDALEDATKLVDEAERVVRAARDEATSAKGARAMTPLLVLEKRVAEVRRRVDAARTHGKTVAPTRMREELRALATEARTSLAAAKRLANAPPTEPVDAPAPAMTTGLVPVCEITIDTRGERGDRNERTRAAMLAIDGGPAQPLPALVRIASGRHTFAVLHGDHRDEQQHLVVCGSFSTLTLEVPR